MEAKVVKKNLNNDLREELLGFEEFLKQIGFKRIDGSIYGLLVMTDRPLSSAQIEEELELSQSAVSQTLKKLTDYKAITSVHDREQNCLVHIAADNTLDIVASVFRKREADIVRNYKLTAVRLKQKMQKQGKSESSQQVKRLQSIITSCELGEAIISFIGTLSDMQLADKIKKITDRLPQVFKLLTTGVGNTTQLQELFETKIKDGILKRVKGITDEK